MELKIDAFLFHNELVYVLVCNHNGPTILLVFECPLFHLTETFLRNWFLEIATSTSIDKSSNCCLLSLHRCVEEYNKDTKLDHVPDILSGRSVDDKIHQSYHEIVMSDSDIDKLVSFMLVSNYVC